MMPAGNEFVCSNNKTSVMKKFLLPAALFLFLPIAVCAQTPDSTSQKPLATERTIRLLKFSDLDQRKIYNWKNGQRSTAAGRQAEAPKAKFVRVWGDSAQVIFDPKTEGK